MTETLTPTAIHVEIGMLLLACIAVYLTIWVMVEDQRDFVAARDAPNLSSDQRAQMMWLGHYQMVHDGIRLLKQMIFLGVSIVLLYMGAPEQYYLTKQGLVLRGAIAI